MFSFSTTTAFVLTVLLCGLVAAGSNNNKNYNCTAIASQNFDGEVFVHAGLYPNDFGKYINRTECAVFKPYTERAVRDYLRWARKGGKIVDGVPSGIPTIPTSGTHHNTFAWDLANGTQILLDLSYLKQINVIYHPITGVPISVKVGCGAHLSDVINITLALGYDVSTTDFMGLSPCGVASGAGGMSPTSPKDGFLATTAEAVTVADYRDGHIETFYRGEQNFKLMLGTAGVMGVMVSITLPLTPIQNNAKTMSLVYFDAQSFKTDADALANSSLCYNAIGSLYLYNAQGKAQSAVVWNDSAVPVGFNNSRFYGLSCTVLYNSTEPSNASMLSLASNYVMSGFAVQPIASKLFATTNMINSRVDPSKFCFLNIDKKHTLTNCLFCRHARMAHHSGAFGNHCKPFTNPHTKCILFRQHPVLYCKELQTRQSSTVYCYTKLKLYLLLRCWFTLACC